MRKDLANYFKQKVRKRIFLTQKVQRSTEYKNGRNRKKLKRARASVVGAVSIRSGGFVIRQDSV